MKKPSTPPKGRWVSYWYQLNELESLAPSSILEIGPGRSVVSGYLKAQGWNVKTVDIAEENRPDVVGSVLSLPFADASVL